MPTAVLPLRTRAPSPVGLPSSALKGDLAGPRAAKKPLLTPRAKAAFWDWSGDTMFGIAIGLSAVLAKTYGMKGGWNAILNRAGPVFKEGKGYGDWATLFVGPAIFLYLGHLANRFPFFPAGHAQDIVAPPAETFSPAEKVDVALR